MNRWLRRASLFTVAFITGCGAATPTSPPPPPAPTTGTIRVNATTTGIMPDPNGYQVSLDAQPARVVGTNSTVTFNSVQPGAHVLDFSDIAINCTTPEAGVNVTVVAGQTLDVPLPVTCGRLAFVSGWASGGFWAVETATFTSQFVGLTQSHSIVDVDATADGSKVYFGQASSRANMGVGSFTTAPLENADYIAIPGVPIAVRLSPDETELYVLDLDGGLAWVDLVNGVETHRITFGNTFGQSWDMELSLDGSLLYTVDTNSGRLLVFDVPGRRLLRTRTLSSQLNTHAVALSADGTRIYVRTSDNLQTQSSLHVLDQATEQQLASVTLSDWGYGLLAHPDGSVLYVPMGNENRVAILDPTTLAEVGSLDVPRPRMVTLDPELEHLYVTADSRLLVVIELATGQEVGRAQVSGGPWDVVFWPPN